MVQVRAVLPPGGLPPARPKCRLNAQTLLPHVSAKEAGGQGLDGFKQLISARHTNQTDRSHEPACKLIAQSCRGMCFVHVSADVSPTYLSMHLPYIYLSNYLPVCLAICAHLCIYASVHVSSYASVCLFAYPSNYYLSIYLSTYLVISMLTSFVSFSFFLFPLSVLLLSCLFYFSCCSFLEYSSIDLLISVLLSLPYLCMFLHLVFFLCFFSVRFGCCIYFFICLLGNIHFSLLLFFLVLFSGICFQRVLSVPFCIGALLCSYGCLCFCLPLLFLLLFVLIMLFSFSALVLSFFSILMSVCCCSSFISAFISVFGFCACVSLSLTFVLLLFSVICVWLMCFSFLLLVISFLRFLFSFITIASLSFVLAAFLCFPSFSLLLFSFLPYSFRCFIDLSQLARYLPLSTSPSAVNSQLHQQSRVVSFSAHLSIHLCVNKSACSFMCLCASLPVYLSTLQSPAPATNFNAPAGRSECSACYSNQCSGETCSKVLRLPGSHEGTAV